MYLLIPYFLLNKPLPYCNLHPTMYLLIRLWNFRFLAIQSYLHPTMYLLIPANANIVTTIASKFTSHYVSINSEFRANPSKYQVNLHPTMYLLIRLSLRR